MAETRGEVIRLPRPAAPVDRVEIVPLDSEEIRAAAAASGLTFEPWRNYWRELDSRERDALTDPDWVAGHLQAQYDADDEDATPAIVTLEGGEVQSLVPIRADAPGALRHARCFASRSWALAERDRPPRWPRSSPRGSRVDASARSCSIVSRTAAACSKGDGPALALRRRFGPSSNFRTATKRCSAR